MSIRTHRIRISVEYEGEPLGVPVIDHMLRNLGDTMGITLRERHEDADGIFTAGLHHDVDFEEKT